MQEPQIKFCCLQEHLFVANDNKKSAVFQKNLKKLHSTENYKIIRLSSFHWQFLVVKRGALLSPFGTQVV